MTASKGNTRRFSHESIGSDMAKVDAHVIQPEEYDELPELTDEDLARGVAMFNREPVKRGRPPVAAPKKSVTLRLDEDVVSHFRAQGPGWQTKINEALRKAAKLKQAG